MNTSIRGVDRRSNTIYTGVVNIKAKPNIQSISNGEWARFIFVAGRLCIDFTQTGGETGKRAYWERFHGPSDLADWFAASPLQLEDVQVSPEDFKLALSLREAVWRTAEAARQNKRFIVEDIDLINRVAAQPDLPPQLKRGGTRTWHSSVAAAQALSLLARDTIDLVSGELRTRIRTCENPNCGLMFVDTSRPGKRRWCLMKRCGNIAKTSRYRKTHS